MQEKDEREWDVLCRGWKLKVMTVFVNFFSSSSFLLSFLIMISKFHARDVTWMEI
jgi:hypothetical protein